MGQYYQSSQAWPPTAGKSKESMAGMGNMANPWAGALSQEYNT
jgi:hypothetical protein